MKGYVVTTMAAGFIFLAACSSKLQTVFVSPAPPNGFTSSFSTLEEKALKTLTEVSKYATNAHLSSRVIQVKYALGTNMVFAVYDDGFLIGWKANTDMPTIEHNLGVVSSNVVAFNASGDLVMGPTSKANGPNTPNGGVDGLALWNTYTGNLDHCLSFPCQGDNPSSNYGYSGAVLNPSGEMAILFLDSSLVIIDKDTPQSIYINDLDSPYQWRIGQVALDALNERHALILREGGVWLSTGNSLRPYRTLLDGKQNELHNIAMAKFDPAGQKLAYIIDDRLVILRVNTGETILDESVNKPVAINFDQAGKFLVIAGDDKVAIWDLDRMKILAQYETLGISSLSISDDNRLLVWGDIKGSVHLWASTSK